MNWEGRNDHHWQFRRVVGDERLELREEQVQRVDQKGVGGECFLSSMALLEEAIWTIVS